MCDDGKGDFENHEDFADHLNRGIDNNHTKSTPPTTTTTTTTTTPQSEPEQQSPTPNANNQQQMVDGQQPAHSQAHTMGETTEQSSSSSPTTTTPVQPERKILLILNSQASFVLFTVSETQLSQQQLLRLSKFNSPLNTPHMAGQEGGITMDDFAFLQGILALCVKVDSCSSQFVLPPPIISSYLEILCPQSPDKRRKDGKDQNDPKHISPFIPPNAITDGFNTAIETGATATVGTGTGNNTEAKPPKLKDEQPYDLDTPVYNPAHVAQFISTIFFIPLQLE